MAQPDDSNIPLVVTVALCMTLAVIAIVAAVEGLYWRHDREYEKARTVIPQYKPLEELRGAQQAKLIKIDLDKAMQETVKEQSAKQGAAGAK